MAKKKTTVKKTSKKKATKQSKAVRKASATRKPKPKATKTTSPVARGSKKKATAKKATAKKATAKKATAKKANAKKATARKKPAAKHDTSLDSTKDKLSKLLDQAKSERKILKLLLPLDESERRKLFPMCQKQYRAQNRDPWIEESSGSFRRNPKISPAQVAVFCTANISEIKKLGRWALPDNDVILEVLEARKPQWCDQLVELLLASSYYWNAWPLCRTLVRRKLCPRPESPRYYMGMITGMVGRWNQKKTNVMRELKADPDLLKDEVWRLFEYEGDRENSLANVDRWEKTNWSGSLVKLSKEGKLSRPRLLDASLGALELGFNHYRARWFFAFFDMLEPTDAELKKRTARILELMRNPAPNVAQWAFDKQQYLLRTGATKIDESLVDANAPLLGGRHKKTVTQVLKLYQQLLEQSPKLKHAVCLATVEALAHEKADVQKAAWKLIEKTGSPEDPELRSLIQQYSAVTAATVTRELKSWLEQHADERDGDANQTTKSRGTPRSTSTIGPNVLKGIRTEYAEGLGLPSLLATLKNADSNTPIEASQFDGTDIPRLDADRRIKPIEAIDDLIESLGRVVEDDNLIDEAERAIDALVRLHASDPEALKTRAAPILKRAKQLLKRKRTAFGGQGMSGDVCGLMIALEHGQPISAKVSRDRSHHDRQFLEGLYDKPVETWFLPGDPLTFMSRRLMDVANLIVRGESTQLLSTPTHEGGWIDAETLVQRINALTIEPAVSDVVLALLRVAPDRRDAALKSWNPKLKGEWVNAIKHGLGASGVRIGSSADLWAASARCREPVRDDAKVAKAFPKFGEGGGMVAKFRVEFKEGARRTYAKPSQPMPRVPSLNAPSQMLNCGFEPGNSLCFHDIGITPGSIRGLASLWPSQRDSFFVAGINNLGANIDWWEAEWHNRCFMEPLLDPDTPFREMGHALLLCGLAAKEPGEHGLAVDITIQAIQDGRLGTDNFAKLLTPAMSTNFFSLTRLAKRIQDVASVSDLHAYVVMKALESALPSASPRNPPRGIGDHIELMNEIGTRLSMAVGSEACRKYLERMKGSGKAAKCAKQLLAIESTFDPREIVELAIQNRLERANVWTDRE